MIRRLSRYFLAGVLLSLVSVSYSEPNLIEAVSSVSSPLERLILHQLDVQNQEPILVQAQVLQSTVLLLKFYEHRSYHAVWSKNKRIVPAAYDLMNALRQSDREGLRPTDYHLGPLERLLSLIEKDPTHAPPQQYADIDLLLTDAFLTYGSHLLSGSINPYSVDNEWFANRRTGDLHEVLESAMESKKIRSTLHDLLPTHPIYTGLRDALARYRSIQKTGDWPVLPEGPSLHRGEQDPRVPLLRLRLHREGYLNQQPNKKEFFDGALERALKQFQRHHGLEEDGILGELTWRELNVPVDRRVRQLEVNMERCRWLPADLGERHILVNVPDFRLQVVEKGRTVLDMRVIVGRKMRRTPVFSSEMNQIVLNPAWTVPRNVAGKDILDHIREEPDYLQKFGFEVYNGYDDGAVLVDPAAVDWSAVNEKNLTYKFRQKPGPYNALGQIKFLFPNRFDVYLHDTSTRSLFDKRVRDFSSGCIRVQKPIDLAEYVLKNHPDWTREKLLKTLKSGAQEQYISLSERIPVHLLYWTAWVDERDNVQFRDDLYGRDEPLDQALHRW